MNNLLTLKLWFGMRPGALMPHYQNYFIILIALLAILTIISGFIKIRNKNNPYNKFWAGIYCFLFTNTAISLVLLFFTYEAIPLLSSRFWFLLWAIEMLIWLFFLIKKLKIIPEKQKQLKKEKEYKKYIP